MSELLEALAPNPLIAILRAPECGCLRAGHRELCTQAGFRCVEFTLTTSGAIEAMEKVLASMPDDLIVGVGTVRTTDQVEEADRRRCGIPGQPGLPSTTGRRGRAPR